MNDGTQDYTEVEIAIGNLYVAFFHLYADGKHQEAFDTKERLVDMLLEDMEHLRKNHQIIG
jgi:hypothetical protein